MKLDMELVYEELKETFPEAVFGAEGGCPPLERPLLYIPGQKTEPERLYISEGTVGEVRDPRAGWICAQGELPEEEIGPCICLPQDRSLVFNAVQQIYDRYEAWERQLQQLENRPDALRQMLLESEELFHNPLVLLSADFTLRVQVGMRQNFFDRRAGSIDFFNNLRQDKTYAANNQTGEPYLLPASVIPCRSWNINLFQGGQVACRLLLLEQDRPLRRSDGYRLSRLAVHLSRVLEAESGMAQPNHLHNIFHRILSDRTADYMEMSSQLEELVWSQ